MASFPRLAVSLACVFLPLAVGATTISMPYEAFARQKDGEPKVDETFGKRAKARRGNDAAALAAELAGKGDFSQARALAERSGDSAAIKIVEWFYLCRYGSRAGYERLMAFVNENPQWPKTADILRSAEKALLDESSSPQVILAHFGTRKPETAEGMMAMARVMAAVGEREQAKTWAGRAWVSAESDADQELRILTEFGPYLTTADHKARLWAKIYEEESNAALRVSKRLPRDYQQAAQAAQLLLREQASGVKAFNKLPAGLRNEPALLYALARYQRKAQRYADAAATLSKLAKYDKQVSHPDPVWIERRIVIRDLLGPKFRKHWTTAYELAAAHGFKRGSNAVEGEFLAGWIMLRYLDQPPAALEHFLRLTTFAASRAEKARAFYWLGRTYSVIGRSDLAVGAYREAAQHEAFYYGQLARDALGLSKRPIAVPGIKPTPEVARNVANDEIMRTFLTLSRGGREGDLGLFLSPIAKRFKTAQEMSAAAELVWDQGGAFMTVRLAKAASSNGVDIDHWGFPVTAMPRWKQMGPKVEKALVFGLARQESEFNAEAGSHAGAKGLMQLMPGTAKLITKQYKLRYDAKRLTSDPSYNVTLGASHLGDLVRDFRGSYILTLVAYNAGPGRSMDWIKRYGDPRSSKVDPIDWVESIPFTETRNYVQKVLQNTHVYRGRLDPSSAHTMTQDLRRGGSGKYEVARIDGSSAGSCGENAQSMAVLISVCD
jgi:soluble lytic murein transglycosylase